MHFVALGWHTGAANMSRYFRLRKCPKAFRLLLAHRVRFGRIIAGVGSIGLHRTLGGDHHNFVSPRLSFRLFSPSSNEGGMSKQRSFFKTCHRLSEPIMRAKNSSLLFVNSSIDLLLTCYNLVAHPVGFASPREKMTPRQKMANRSVITDQIAPLMKCV